MAYNNGFPMNYQYYMPQFQPVQNPYMQTAQPTQQMQQPQAMTPPTIHADIIQVESEAEAERYPMAANQPPQMFMTRDESTIIIKTMLANNQHEMKVYPLRPPAPPAPPVDLAAYVTREELNERLAAILRPTQAQKQPASKDGEE